MSGRALALRSAVGDTSTLGLTVVSMVIALVGAALGVHYRRLLKVADEQSRRAEAANRVKDEFLATLSHELRTPLNSVLGWARLLATGKLDSTQTAGAIQAIERAGWAQSRLIEDLLDLSRIISGKLQIHLAPTVLQPVVDAAVDSLRPAAAAKHIALTVTLDRTLGVLAADPDRVQQIVWNLVSNAIKFTPIGGRVDVRLSATSDEAIISVKDTGIGFNRHLAAHLFERVHQGDSTSTRQYSGLGLGLGIVRHLAELHGGTVTASSRGEDAGSLFEVRLPIVKVTAPALDERRHIERRRSRNLTVPREALQHGGS
jgi:signal transduction histidine kinase